MQHAEAGDPSAIGALLVMYLGLRQGKVAARVARDIDDDGRLLWIPSGKTKNAKPAYTFPRASARYGSSSRRPSSRASC